MKRIRMLVLLGAVAVALPLGLSAAHATGGGGSGTQVTIQEHADYDIAGTRIDVGLYVRCTDATGFGVLDVTVDQYPPETPYPVGVASVLSRSCATGTPTRSASPSPVPGSTREGPRPRPT